MNQEELKNFHEQEVDVLRVFSVMSAAHLNEDGVSRIRFAIANNNGDALRFLDNGEILEGIAKTEEGKRCFKNASQEEDIEYARMVGAGQFILGGDYFVHRVFYENNQHNIRTYSKSSCIDVYNPNATTPEQNAEMEKTQFDRWYATFAENFSCNCLKFCPAPYGWFENDFYDELEEHPERKTIKVQTLLNEQNRIDKEILKSPYYEEEKAKQAEKKAKAELHQALVKQEDKENIYEF